MSGEEREEYFGKAKKNGALRGERERKGGGRGRHGVSQDGKGS